MISLVREATGDRSDGVTHHTHGEEEERCSVYVSNEISVVHAQLLCAHHQMRVGSAKDEYFSWSDQVLPACHRS